VNGRVIREDDRDVADERPGRVLRGGTA
jgi:hypothetical protein